MCANESIHVAYICKSVSILISDLHNNKMEYYVIIKCQHWVFFFQYLNLISTLTVGIILNYALPILAYRPKPLTQSKLANMALLLIQGPRRKD